MKTITNVTLGIALTLSAVAVACSPTTSASAPSTTATTSAQLLDGRNYAINVVLPDGKEVGTNLSFTGGKFESAACTEAGFGPTAYTAGRDGDAITFRVVLQNDKGKRETWTGRVMGDAIEGTITSEEMSLKFRGKAI